MSDLYVPYQKKCSPNIDGIHIVGGKIALIPVVSSSRMIYTNVVSVPAEKHNIYGIHHHLSPQVAPTHLTLRGQCCIYFKNVFTSCESGHKTFSGLYSPWVRGRD
jgi:hypothetical protein